jgi:hypothetical protein
MRLFIDECVPTPLIPIVTRLVAPDHEVDSAATRNWRGKPDGSLIRDVARQGYDVFLTGDTRQLDDPAEIKAIHDARIHHVRYKTIDGLDGLAHMSGAICAMIRPILNDLRTVSGQRLVLLTPQFPKAGWYAVTDPRDTRHGPSYWPR